MDTIEPAQALVVVPFATVDEATAWAEKVAADYPSEPPLLVTEGQERVLVDPSSGDARYELCFQGGWRAKVADSHQGVVVITRGSN